MKINGSSNSNNGIKGTPLEKTGLVNTKITQAKKKESSFIPFLFSSENSSKNNQTSVDQSKKSIQNIKLSKNFLPESAKNIVNNHPEEPLAPESKPNNSFKNILSKIISNVIGLFRLKAGKKSSEGDNVQQGTPVKTLKKKISKKEAKYQNKIQEIDKKIAFFKRNIERWQIELQKPDVPTTDPDEKFMLQKQKSGLSVTINSHMAEVNYLTSEKDELMRKHG